MGGKDGFGINILSNVETAYAKLGKDINPVGQFNLKLQLLIRILFMQVFLAQLFKDDDKEAKLDCDVKNIGCEDVCKNRFMPISHWRFWHIELYAWMLSIFIMIGLRYIVDKTVAASVAAKSNPKMTRNSTLIKQGEHFKKLKDEDTTPALIKIGYLITLFVRFGFEYWCLKIEMELNRNQSQNAGFWPGLSLNEKWMCYTDGDRDDDLPEANRSAIFWHGEENLACTNAEKSVPCWIAKSRMKSWGLKLMYIALLINFFMTLGEILYHVAFGLRSKSKKVIKENLE